MEQSLILYFCALWACVLLPSLVFFLPFGLCFTLSGVAQALGTSIGA